MRQVFDFQEPYYSLRSETSQFRRGNMKSTNYGTEPVKFPRYGPWYLKILKILNLCKSLRG